MNIKEQIAKKNAEIRKMYEELKELAKQSDEIVKFELPKHAGYVPAHIAIEYGDEPDYRADRDAYAKWEDLAIELSDIGVGPGCRVPNDGFTWMPSARACYSMTTSDLKSEIDQKLQQVKQLLREIQEAADTINYPGDACIEFYDPNGTDEMELYYVPNEGWIASSCDRMGSKPFKLDI